MSVSVTTNPTGEAALADTSFDQDRGGAITQLAQGINAEAYFDADGNFHLDPAPDPATAILQWTVDAGDQGVLVSHGDQLERQNAQNGVLVVGQPDAATPPVTSLAVDDDPSSPTAWGGGRGKVPLIIKSTTVQSQTQADTVAAAELQRTLGLARTLTLNIVANPALEPDDAIDVVFGDGTVERHIIDQATFPLNTVDTMQLVTRSIYTPTVGLYRDADAWAELRQAVAADSGEGYVDRGYAVAAASSLFPDAELDVAED